MSQTFNLGGLGDNKLTKLIFSNGTANTCSVFLDNDGYLVFEQGASTVTFPLGDLPADTRLAIENGRVVKGKVITYEISGGSEDTSTSTETVSAGYPTGMYAADNLSNYPGFTNAMYFDGSSYLSRTNLSSVTDESKVTISLWYKIGNRIGLRNAFLDTFDGSNNNSRCSITTDLSNQFRVAIQNASNFASQIEAESSAVFRDPSAWYHFVIMMDTGATNKLIVYTNGVEIIGPNSVAPTVNTFTQPFINKASRPVTIGRGSDSTESFNGYMANIQFVDGQALDASNFGQYMVDSNGNTTSAWVPKLYDGDYGTNGFLLDFSSLELNSSGDIIQVNDTAPKSDGQSPNNWTAN